ncbi:MAG: LysR family transcriptional regulator [Pseudomonadota bacterium]
MGQLEDFRFFIAIVQSDGISKAAAKLGIAKSAISRRLRLLEERYGAQLINRRPGHFEVTETGQQLYQRAVEIVGSADEIEADFAQTALSAAGPLSVSVPDDFGRAFLTPMLLDFRAEHREIQLNVDFDNRHADLVTESYDLAIRLTNEPPDFLIATHLGHWCHSLYASPDYVEDHGNPQSLDGLSDHPLLFHGGSRRAVWDFEVKGGTRSFTFQPSFSSNSGAFLLQAALAGEGIARLPDFLAAPKIAGGELVEVLGDVKIATRGIYLLRTPERRMNRRVRLFAEAVQNTCAANFGQ